MMISTRGRYALRVMLDLAQQAADEYVPLKEIAHRQDISEKYLEIILKVLVRNQLLNGMRGKGGGYRLTRKPSEYTLGEILRLTEGSLAPVACAEKGNTNCPRHEICPSRPVWQQLDTLINDYLDGITLEDLIKTP
ncbi:MAG: RrF2 family transcriptional regulator [Clostridium sp.]|nr:RrF2 family transcriptional regulator [Clostridium sp.]